MTYLILAVSMIGFIAATAWLLAVYKMTECHVAFHWRVAGFLMALSIAAACRDEIVYYHIYEGADGAVDLIINKAVMRLMLIAIAIYCCRCHTRACAPADDRVAVHCNLAQNVYVG